MTRTSLAILLALCFAIAPAKSSFGETLAGALARAYETNPTIHSQRAAQRANDENVPRALSQFRPRVKTDAYLGIERRRSADKAFEIDNGNVLEPNWVDSFQNTRGLPRAAALSVEQPLFDGFRAKNSALSAETNVFAGRERLRLIEQRVLFEAATVYMNVLRDTAALRLQQNHVAVLQEQLHQTKERYAAGEITPTDIAQAEARLAAGRSQAAAARAELDAAVARYRQVVGAEPKQLAPGGAIDRLLPRTRDAAERIALAEHPVVRAALHDADAAEYDIKVIESDYMPSLSMVGKVYTQSDIDGRGNRALGAQLLGKLSVPLYSGGETSARMRQAKEVAGQKKFDVDVARAELLALTRANWGALDAAKAQVAAASAQIEAAERALLGVREEAKAGKRTTLDILNAQQELLGARIGLVFAQRDRVVASYAALAAIGRLSTHALGLSVAAYDPASHFDRVKDSWGEMATGSGR
ncbi:TolC family outer membrane protein [Methylosinus sp. Sm6]|uniref:TolC family outer membrane protein n=1 Tax=Methylosinus sp. Sm6 TaxID=2866948 RepID=UPI001C997058|nr:TolC family outer membrane protein [Methylosinus sp. Sm6]MBY6240615.1 TolC family outer membrane protein [Methylosinus sp. Sm6]